MFVYKNLYFTVSTIGYNAKIPMNSKYITTDIQNQLYELRLSKNVVGYTNSNLFYEMQ